jgi:hypothetical protein
MSDRHFEIEFFDLRVEAWSMSSTRCSDVRAGYRRTHRDEGIGDTFV